MIAVVNMCSERMSIQGRNLRMRETVKKKRINRHFIITTEIFLKSCLEMALKSCL